MPSHPIGTEAGEGPSAQWAVGKRSSEKVNGEASSGSLSVSVSTGLATEGTEFTERFFL